METTLTHPSSVVGKNAGSYSGEVEVVGSSMVRGRRRVGGTGRLGDPSLEGNPDPEVVDQVASIQDQAV